MEKSPPEDYQAELSGDLKQAKLEYSADLITRLLYSTDASIYQIMPIAVVWPKNSSEVQSILDIGRKHQAPVLPRGGGSSLAGQAIGRSYHT